MPDGEALVSAPYTVLYSGGERGFDSFEEALDFASGANGRVLGDGYDFDCDQDGYYLCSDGLTDAERERVEEVLG